MSHRYFSRLHRRLAEAGVVISIDLPGFAGLPKPRTDVNVEEMADALTRVIAAHGVGPVVLVGHSMGAQWIVEAARQRPDLVRQVIVIGPVTDERDRTLLGQATRLAADTTREPPAVNMIVLTDYLRCGAPWYFSQVRHMLDYPLEQRVSELSMRVVIIRGGDDRIAPLPWCRRLRDSARDGALLVVPGHAHVMQHSAPKAVASAIHSSVVEEGVT